MLYRWVQLVLPLTQTMHEFSDPDLDSPPHTTSLPPDRRERLWWDRGPGRLGTEHVSLGGGKISTDESLSLLAQPYEPPTISCPDAKV